MHFAKRVSFTPYVIYRVLGAFNLVGICIRGLNAV